MYIYISHLTYSKVKTMAVKYQTLPIKYQIQFPCKMFCWTAYCVQMNCFKINSWELRSQFRYFFHLYAASWSKITNRYCNLVNAEKQMAAKYCQHCYKFYLTTATKIKKCFNWLPWISVPAVSWRIAQHNRLFFCSCIIAAVQY